ncbi:alpha-(1-_3)-arabinofuranosyltransferase domain-containing protein [Arsenicicoccus sp. oral taxon 190]|uniref:alpha-(1->3)-arabinofuranosyltransferase domain-containing protein n=1 Tax=Arsenicicoccus sp. oral taxon 190 TaxID=1658671 RepID=UPI00067AA68B|nr:alpha-(1->3)-arabinofuranosyltransferase family protein [Arsenicicoccus sp. oral taxon 190]
MTSTPPVVWRVRVVTACLLLTALAFLQGGGRVVPDTKLDLTLDPLAFLQRALHVWDPAGHLGQLQNQAYGYLFPMGSVHLLLRLAQVPEWVTQRLWWSLVLCTAFLGFWRLTRAIGVGGSWSRYLGALLFAVSPRFLTEIAITSIEVWPMAMAPWVLLPLVDPRPRHTRRRVLQSALAFGCIGGVNAVATGAALVLPTLWWLTRAPLRRGLRDLAAWLVACLLAGSWWLGPLLVLGRYSPPFLDWIEDAAATTSTASAFSAVQGTTHWLAYLRLSDGPTWPAGWLVVSQPVLVVVTTVPAILGLAGMALKGLPQAGFWRLATVTGLVLLTLGFSGAGHGPVAEPVRALLDGPLAALRNIHKFELVLRIPVLVGLVHAAHALAGPARHRRAGAPLIRREVVGALVGALVVTAAAPGVAAMLPRDGAYEQIPDYWREAARWLDDRPGPGTVLVVPAAPFADLTWGSPRDEPLQALMRRPFAVRDAVPLGSAGSTRYLDEVERALRTGSATPALRQSLVDAGIRYLVVRNDLRAAARQAPVIAVHQALADAGIARVQTFGPPTGSAYESDAFTVDEHTLLPYPSLEVYDAGPVTDARLVPVTDLVSLTGGPEDVPAVGGRLPGGVTVLGDDRAALPAGTRLPEVLADGNQRREVSFGRASDNRSPVLTADDPGSTARRVKDYLVDPRAPRTVLRWEGIAGVSASSSASDAGTLVHTSSGDSPAAALDGDPGTHWLSGTYQRSVGEWLEVRLTAPRDLTGTLVTFASPGPGAAAPVLVDVTTDAGTTTMRVDADSSPGAAGTLLLPPGPSARVRLTLRTTTEGVQRGFAVSEIAIPGLRAVPRLVMPPTPSGSPDVVLVRREETGRTGCLRQGGRPLCADTLTQSGEEAGGIYRELSTSKNATYGWSGTVSMRSTEDAASLLDAPTRVRATASSSRIPSIVARPGAVVDADPHTGWIAAPTDPRPTLRLTLPAPRRLTGLRLDNDPYLPASRPRRVEVRLGDGSVRDLPVALDGTVRFTATTDRLSVTFTRWDGARSMEPVSRYVQTLPVGVTEVVLLGAEDLVRPLDRGAPVGQRCGDGPELRVDGRTWRSRLAATVGDVLDQRPLAWLPCDGAEALTLDPGDHLLSAAASESVQPVSLELATLAAPVRRGATTGTDVAARDGGYPLPERATATVLVLPHNANPGWRATDDAGHPLTPIRLDGRRQGWVVPAGPATVVRPTFTPQVPYAVTLAAGFLALLLVGAGVWWERRVAARHAGAGPLREARGARWLAAAAAVVLLPLVGGAAGVVAVLLATAWSVTGALWRREGVARAAATVVPGAVAVALVAARPWGAGGAAIHSWWVQAATLTAVALATLHLPGRWVSGRRPPRQLEPQSQPTTPQSQHESQSQPTKTQPQPKPQPQRQPQPSAGPAGATRRP